MALTWEYSYSTESFECRNDQDLLVGYVDEVVNAPYYTAFFCNKHKEFKQIYQGESLAEAKRCIVRAHGSA